MCSIIIRYNVKLRRLGSVSFLVYIHCVCAVYYQKNTQDNFKKLSLQYSALKDDEEYASSKRESQWPAQSRRKRPRVRRKNTAPNACSLFPYIIVLFMFRLQSHAFVVLWPPTCVWTQGRGEVVYTRFSEPDRVWWRGTGALGVVFFLLTQKLSQIQTATLRTISNMTWSIRGHQLRLHPHEGGYLISYWNLN